MRRLWSVAAALVLCGLFVAGSASPVAGQESSDHAADDHQFHHHHVGVLVGGMTPLSETSETSFALGADYEYRFNERWGAGAGVDFTFGDHKRAAVVAGAVTYRLTPALRVGTGPGFEVVEKDKPGGGTKSKAYFVWGFLASYEFHLGSLSLAPTLYLDFVGETKTNLTYGITVGTGF